MGAEEHLPRYEATVGGKNYTITIWGRVVTALEPGDPASKRLLVDRDLASRIKESLPEIDAGLIQRVLEEGKNPNSDAGYC